MSKKYVKGILPNKSEVKGRRERILVAPPSNSGNGGNWRKELCCNLALFSISRGSH